MSQTRFLQGIILFARNQYVYPKAAKGRKRPPPVKTVNLVMLPRTPHCCMLTQKPGILTLPGNPEPALYRYIAETLFSRGSAAPYWLRETSVTLIPGPPPELAFQTALYVPDYARPDLELYRGWLKHQLERLWRRLPPLLWTELTETGGTAP